MGVSAQSLQNHPAFASLGPMDAAMATTIMEPVVLDAGEVLWRQGERGSELIIVVRGELDVAVDGVLVGRIPDGELAGEASAFIDEARHHTTVTARSPCELMVARVEDVHAMRQAAPNLYLAFLHRAVATAARRVKVADAAVTDLTRGERARPEAHRDLWLTRVWREWTSSGVTGVPRPLQDLVRRLPALTRHEPEVIARMLRLFERETTRGGVPLFLEGDTGDVAYVVAEGMVDVVRTTSDGGATRLTTAGPGTLIGAAALVQKGRRSASCIPQEDGWVYGIRIGRWAQVSAAVRIALYEMVLGTLSEQIAKADSILVDAGGTYGRS